MQQLSPMINSSYPELLISPVDHKKFQLILDQKHGIRVWSQLISIYLIVGQESSGSRVFASLASAVALLVKGVIGGLRQSEGLTIERQA